MSFLFLFTEYSRHLQNLQYKSLADSNKKQYIYRQESRVIALYENAGRKVRTPTNTVLSDPSGEAEAWLGRLNQDRKCNRK